MALREFLSHGKQKQTERFLNRETKPEHVIDSHLTSEPSASGVEKAALSTLRCQFTASCAAQAFTQERLHP